MKHRVFVDGQEGTTGLRIHEYLAARDDIEVLRIAPELRKDAAERARLLNAADVAFLCLPDAASREAAALITNPNTCLIDASTAHRTAPGWVFGLPELAAGQRAAIRASKRIANPGCHASAFILLLRPLVDAGVVPSDAAVTATSITGYSGGGKSMIADYEAAAAAVPGGLAAQPNSPLAAPRPYALALAQGVQIHTHTNGDEATEMVLDQLEAVLRTQPGPDHRFILQHCQLADAAQFRRMKALGMGVNLFANHHFYWGDQHRDITVGPERAERMNACRSALDTGVPFAIHSDAPITPLAPLFTAWCAVNRLTASGRVLGANQRIGVMDALRAVTLGAAWTLKLDGEIGSIECGKRADFCVLEDDPTEVGAERLKDVRVWGTVQGGRVFQA